MTNVFREVQWPDELPRLHTLASDSTCLLVNVCWFPPLPVSHPTITDFSGCIRRGKDKRSALKQASFMLLALYGQEHLKGKRLPLGEESVATLWHREAEAGSESALMRPFGL